MGLDLLDESLCIIISHWSNLLDSAENCRT